MSNTSVLMDTVQHAAEQRYDDSAATRSARRSHRAKAEAEIAGRRGVGADRAFRSGARLPGVVARDVPPARIK
jgi:hypothetical protein